MVLEDLSKDTNMLRILVLFIHANIRKFEKQSCSSKETAFVGWTNRIGKPRRLLLNQ